MSRNLTPLPARTGRAGTFDGMEKLFFDRAAAIEAGEMTAPPEIVGEPRGLWRRWLARLGALALYQKIGLGAGLLFMVLAAVLALRGGSAATKAEPMPTPPPAALVAPSPAASPARAEVRKPRPAARAASTARRAGSRHARTKHTLPSKTSTTRR